MKRSYLLFLLGILLCFLPACGNDNPEKDEKLKNGQEIQEKQAPEDQHNTAVKKQENAREKTEEYRNEEYGFTLRIPASWNGKYEVKRIKAEFGEEAIFSFMYKKENVDLFQIIVLNISKEEWNRDYSGGLMEYLGEKDGKIFAYQVPSGMSLQLSQNKKDKLLSIKDISLMVNHDVPRIVKTFKLTY